MIIKDSFTFNVPGMRFFNRNEALNRDNILYICRKIVCFLINNYCTNFNL